MHCFEKVASQGLNCSYPIPPSSSGPNMPSPLQPMSSTLAKLRPLRLHEAMVAAEGCLLWLCKPSKPAEDTSFLVRETALKTTSLPSKLSRRLVTHTSTSQTPTPLIALIIMLVPWRNSSLEFILVSGSRWEILTPSLAFLLCGLKKTPVWIISKCSNKSISILPSCFSMIYNWYIYIYIFCVCQWWYIWF